MIRRAAISETKSSVFLSRRDETGAHDKLPSVSFAYGFDNTNQFQRKASCACGGGCPHCQAKKNLSVSHPNDPAEIEADQIAEQVMRMPLDEAEAPAIPDTLKTLNRKCVRCTDVEERIQRKALPFSEAIPSQIPAHVQHAIGSDGQPLDGRTRSFFESRFGYDFSGVHIHTGSAAEQSAEAINARAYGLGSHIVFGNGEFRPESESGKHLLAHELAHVIQQARNGTAAHGDGVVHRQTPGPPGELPLPPRCSIIFDIGGSNYGPRLKCEGLPGIGSTPEIPIDPRQIPPYVKDKLGDLVPKSPPGSNPPRDGGPVPVEPQVIPLPPDIVERLCKDFPSLCIPHPKPTLGPLVPLRRLRVLFRHAQPQPGQSLADALAGGRGAIDDAISTMKSDVLVTAILIGNASSEGPPERNFGLSDERVALVYKEFEAEQISWRVFEPELNAEDLTNCRSLGFGRWSCGEKKANHDQIDPHDRNVMIVLYRRLVFEPPRWSIPGPSKPWHGLPGSMIGPF